MNNKLRRSILLATATDPGGGGNLTFPIILVEGDNGQIGIDLFKYVYSRLVAIESYDIPTYSFKDDELITSISPEGAQFQILEFKAVPTSDELLLYRTYIDGWDTYLYLDINGVVRFMQL